MSSELEQELRALGESERLDRSVREVMARGDQVRRGRAKRLNLGAAAVALAGVAAMAGFNGIGNQQQPVADEAPVVSTELKLVNLTQPELDSAVEQCADVDPTLAQAGPPLAAVTAGDVTVLTYHVGDEGISCEITEGSAALGVLPTIFGWPWNPDEATGRGAAMITYGFLTEEMIAEDDEPDPRGPHMTSFGFVESDVVSVEARIGGKTIQGVVEDGMFALWSTEPFTTEDYNNASLVATTANGKEIVAAFP
jgi:hypothetical protein